MTHVDVSCNDFVVLPAACVEESSVTGKLRSGGVATRMGLGGVDGVV